MTLGTGQQLLNLAQDSPTFLLSGLLPGHGYIVTVTATNVKGVSEPATLHAFTLKETEPEHIVADTSRQANLVVTPVLVILIAILAGLALGQAGRRWAALQTGVSGQAEKGHRQRRRWVNHTQAVHGNQA